MLKFMHLLLVITSFTLSQMVYADASADSDDLNNSKESSQTPPQQTIPPLPLPPSGPPKPTPPSQPTQPPQTESAPIQTSFNTFTGKILKSKVRMRLEPSVDSRIIRELNAGDLFMVVGEAGDFYAVEPPSDIKAYIFRTYVLDGVIEGNHVNVRLEPDLSAPVIAQMNSGDHVRGVISSSDKRWLEILPPPSTRFYIAKEFVTKAGNASMMANLKRRSEEVTSILDNARLTSQVELQKPFNQIELNPTTQRLNKIITQYSDFPQQATEAKELLNSIQTAFLNKKVAYMESTQNAPQTLHEEAANPPVGNGITSKMAEWMPAEQAQYEEWKKQNENGSNDDFYQQQAQTATSLRGILEPYNRNIKNKPGDFVLVSRSTGLPLGYLYSTRINLQNSVGQEVTVKVAPRANNNFAYPAWYVLAIEQ